MHGPWPSASPQGRQATPRPSRPSWPPSVFRAADPGGPGPGLMPSLRTARTRPARSEITSANAVSALSSPSRLTRSATVCGEAVPAADRRPSMPKRTSSATRSSDALTGSSSGAVWPCERTSSPLPTRPHSTLPRSSSGSAVKRPSGRNRNARPQAKSPLPADPRGAALRGTPPPGCLGVLDGPAVHPSFSEGIVGRLACVATGTACDHSNVNTSRTRVGCAAWCGRSRVGPDCGHATHRKVAWAEHP
ncbi:hypothetical protein M2436_000025 [Streptomyces sp. HB372]|nr:hypothetical protein [Streptomyces sp. HB372]